jgi:hypothetical protein
MCASSSAFVAKGFLHMVQRKSLSKGVTVLIWSDLKEQECFSWSLSVRNAFLHAKQRKGLSVWIFVCRVCCVLDWKHLPHTLHGYGRSPVWLRICISKDSRRENNFEQ